MGNSQSDTGLNTAGQVVNGGLSNLPGGAAFSFIFRKITSWLGIFHREPEAINDTMLEIKLANDAAHERHEAEAKAEERARQAHEQELGAAKEREEAVMSAVRLQEEAEAAAEEARKREVAARRREDTALIAAEESVNALNQGIRPVVMPNEQQYKSAMERIQYSSSKFHFAVCGTAGSGKSSLVNAFRGILKDQKDAAAVGVTETTSQITRYPDPRNELPYSRFVWYDIPGAGTMAVSDWQYFNDQGLFVFDFIIMVYDVRFTKIDVSIIENCYRFNIPVFIVRSKADQHINNMMTDLGIDSTPGSDTSQQRYQDTKATYVETTKSDFEKHMMNMAEKSMFDARDRQMLLSQRVYMVSAGNVRELVLKGSGVDGSKIVDELLLFEDLLSTTVRRRYLEAEWKRLFKRGREAMSGAFSSLGLGSRSDVEAPSSRASASRVYELDA